jgi:hypothetical protein
MTRYLDIVRGQDVHTRSRRGVYRLARNEIGCEPAVLNA